MLTKEEKAAKVQELGGDCLVFTGPLGADSKWTVILARPEMKDVDYYRASMVEASSRIHAPHQLVRSMVRFVDPVADKYEPGEIPGAKADYDHLRNRCPFISDGIYKERRFDRFIGLQVDAEEKE